MLSNRHCSLPSGYILVLNHELLSDFSPENVRVLVRVAIMEKILQRNKRIYNGWRRGWRYTVCCVLLVEPDL